MCPGGTGQQDLKGLEVSVLQAAEGRDGMTILARDRPPKEEKSRTLLQNIRSIAGETILYQKYYPLQTETKATTNGGLTNAQVSPWFQNRRAKLKRDLEEMKADVESAKKLSPTQWRLCSIYSELEETESLFHVQVAPKWHGPATLQMSPSSPTTDHTQQRVLRG
ncbi:hypothetical protein GDO81_004159 [Engystomops pustulosus]|uniref:Homeobox domain-containing protein n=1 Tax=Engystomops pustulosus TaxID=76066 RepID=A0AAV6ZZP4_ENGPU|nr:hypothetical protein GDO81_004159 [Engystomops pustulosus]